MHTHCVSSIALSRPQLPESFKQRRNDSRNLQATPKLHEPSGDLTLGDLWAWFEQPSLFGCPVHTTGCTLGSSTAFFVPLLSAMRLYTTCDSCSPATTQQQGLAPQTGCALVHFGA